MIGKLGSTVDWGKTEPLQARVLMDPSFYSFITDMASHADTDEVGGVALVRRQESCFIVGPEHIFPKQEVTGGSVELDDTAVQAWLVSQLGEDVVYAKNPTLNLCLWHSHGSGAPFLSGTDEAWIKQWLNPGFVISIVTNRNGALYSRADTLVGGHGGVQIRLPVDLGLNLDLSHDYSVGELYKELVTSRVVTSVKAGPRLPLMNTSGPAPRTTANSMSGASLGAAIKLLRNKAVGVYLWFQANGNVCIWQERKIADFLFDLSLDHTYLRKEICTRLQVKAKALDKFRYTDDIVHSSAGGGIKGVEARMDESDVVAGKF